MTDIALEATGLGKRYGAAWALRGCSLRLPAGRIAALVGPNGAGKSTLLHLAVGLLRPDAGQVRIFGQDPVGNTEALAEIGFVAQDAPLYQDFTAAELITMGGKLNRRWEAAPARERLTRLGIALDRPVGRLSGGQRAQVALALALAKQPRLLLLDEPIAALDPLARHEFMQTLMGAVAETGATVLLSSHLLAELERSCDHLILLRTSQVQLAGAVEDLLAEHRRLIGPRTGSGGPIPGVAEVVRASHTDRQSTLLVRTDGAAFEPGWTVHEVTLEDLVLAHLAAADTRTAMAVTA
ncbi:ABC transporter ATP-binding protein [Kitasatospora sp. NBC_01287]|uniref:ABC transporter ATP-binding protein n=1 Tax=Kitasatospora sp. NBC_01287 TaxID=2903573 RepID=UPI00224C95D7|nr:ABC transporter ATP-binding protein [Kitasatospora sp. NBC_01287]MCX4749951.1 ABC transporter ATP-binding protein [Kitasatospora sp. NBC_01287]